MRSILTYFFILISHISFLDASLCLRNNLQKTHIGDYIVTVHQKNYTLLHILDKTADQLTIEEITVPVARITKPFSWRDWVKNHSLGHTSWILYAIDVTSGKITKCYSVSQKGWLNLSNNESFLPTLLSLQLRPIPRDEWKKVGPPPAADAIDRRPLWQPRMVVEGQHVKGVAFNAWRTQWPKDSSELSDMIIDIYLPTDNSGYPSYFPYWLQVQGLVGKASVYVIDSGSQLVSPAKMPQE